MKTIQEGLNKTSAAFQEFVVSSSSLLLASYPYSHKEKQSWRFFYNNKDSNVSKKPLYTTRGQIINFVSTKWSTVPETKTQN